MSAITESIRTRTGTPPKASVTERVSWPVRYHASMALHHCADALYRAAALLEGSRPVGLEQDLRGHYEWGYAAGRKVGVTRLQETAEHFHAAGWRDANGGERA